MWAEQTFSLISQKPTNSCIISEAEEYLRKMVAIKQVIFAAFIVCLLMLSEMEVTNAMPGMMFGKGHHGDNGIGQLLAAGLVISMLQQHG